LNRISPYAPFIGLILIFFYWWSIHPLVFATGYVEDLCGDMVRQMMAENLTKYGRPVFHTDSMMAPYGASVPYMSWSIERDWLGAYFWKWNPRFSFLYAYFGVSLLITYLGVAGILRKMKLGVLGAWGLATAVVLFHMPRHFKTWHHFEHLPEHWLYLSLFMDAWIWQRFWRDRKWSIHLEFWRGVLVLCTFLATGYYWGAMILEWLVIRYVFLGVFYYRKRKGISVEVEWNKKQLLWPVLAGLAVLAIEIPWFWELYQEAKVVGKVMNNTGWFAYFYQPFVPLWFNRLFPSAKPFYHWSETATSVGWFFLIPLFIAISSLRKKKGGPGYGAALPFLIFIALVYAWETRVLGLTVIEFFRSAVPFLEFFRVGTRWSLVMPAIIGTILALSWPELTARVQNWYHSHRKARVWVILFLVSSGVELTWLGHPVNMTPPMPARLDALLAQLKSMPGDTVIDLPFCVAGGNGYCTEQQCPNYPYSSVGQCLRLWHEKKIYGLYQARMTTPHCDKFNRLPYTSWFSAWAERRCLTPMEWDGFCDHLKSHPETAGVLFYPDIWAGAGTPECLASFDAHLGRPLGEAVMSISPSMGGKETYPSRVILYPGRCIEAGSPVGRSESHLDRAGPPR
jgi:hypothetical protein